MAWALVQSVVSTPASPAATTSRAFTANVVAGNRIFVHVTASSTGTSTAPAAPTDSQSNTYTQLASSQLSVNNPLVAVYTAVVGASGPLTVTVGLGTLATTGGTEVGFTLQEFSGLSTAAGTGCLNVSATGTATSSPVPTGTTAATTAANQLALAAVGDWGAGLTYAAPSGYTLDANATRQADGFCGQAVAYKNSASGAAEGGSFTYTPTGAQSDAAYVLVLKLSTATALAATVRDSDQLSVSATSTAALIATVLDRDAVSAALVNAVALVAVLADGDVTTANLASAAALFAVLVESDTTAAALATPTALAATVLDRDATTAAPASAMVLSAAVVDSDTVIATSTLVAGLTATVTDGDTATATLQTTTSATSLTVSIIDADTVTVTLVSAVTLTAALTDGDAVTVTLASAVTLTASIADSDTVTAGLTSAVLAFITTTDGDLLTAILTTGDRQFGLYNALRIIDDWTFAVGAWTGLPDTALPEATGRRATWKLLGNSDVTFTLDSELPEASQIHELITDLWIFWKTRPLFRGRIGSTSDTGDGATYTTTFNAADYRELLRRRQLYEGDSLYYSQLDQAQVGLNVISQTQARSGGNLGIVPGVGQTTGVIAPATTYPAGKSVGEAIDQLSLVENGFDFDFGVVLDANRRPTTGLTFDVYYPQRGTDRQVFLDHPGRIASFTRGAVASDYANALRVTGDTALAAIRVEAPHLESRPEGRWDAQFGDTSILQSSTLAARAKGELAIRQFTRASWTVTLEPDVWQGPDHIWIGDPVTLVVQKGRLNVVETLRVQEFTLALDSSAAPTISLTLGAPPPRAKWDLRRLDRRLTALERR